MNIGDVIKIIRELLNLTQQELALKLGVQYELINRWENNKVVPENRNINMIYSFAFDNKIYINNIYEQFYKEENTDENNVVLFHGAKEKISTKIDLNHPKKQNDFGIGFYLGESFYQAATYISYSKSNTIYSYVLNTCNLKIIKFDVDLRWMLAIAYYRGWIDEFKEHEIIKEIISEVESSDVVIAPIADNKMFDLIDEFVSGMTTDEQCKHALSATNLGFQYVIKTNKGLDQLNFLDEMFLCEKERNNYLSKRLESNKIGLDKVKIARIEYKNKGKYIGEILK